MVKQILTHNPLKVVCLDLDETLGYFGPGSILFSIMNEYDTKIHPDEIFQKYLKEYNGIRPGTIELLRTLYDLKKKKYIDKLCIWTAASNHMKWVTFLVNSLCKISSIPIDAFDIILTREDSLGKMYVNGHSRVEKNMLFLAKKLNCSDTSNFIMIDDKPQYVTNIIENNNIAVGEYKHNIDYTNFVEDIECDEQTKLFLIKSINEDIKSNYVYNHTDPSEDINLFVVINILKKKLIPKEPVEFREIFKKEKNRGISMKTKIPDKKWKCKGCKNISKNKFKIEQIGPHHGKECYKYCMLTIPSLGVI